MSLGGEWEPEAENWVRWARTPGHDGYWYWRDAFFDSLLPVPGRTTLEVGCGEGRVARDLSARGHRVIGIDSSPSLVCYAQEADPGGSYTAADSAALPYPDSTFDAAVAYNSLQVVNDMAGTVREIARVLTPGGYFCACVAHPLADTGNFVSEEPDARYLLRPDYFARRRVDDRVERDGLEMRFRGWTYALEDYSVAFEQAGLQIEQLREPRPVDPPARYSRWSRLPMFLLIRSRKP